MKPLTTMKTITACCRLFIVSFALFPLTVLAQVCGEINSPFPEAPETDRTTGHRQQLITRGENHCPSPAYPLTALMSPQGSDYTFSSYPSFWFFIPFNETQVEKLEFVLADDSESREVYRTTLQPPSKAGLIEISLPEKVEYALKENQQYRWYFLLDCEGSPSEQPDLEVNGWITRRPLTATIGEKMRSQEVLSLYLAYQNHHAWYDAVSYLAKIRQENPNDLTAKTIWENLLACLQLQWVAQVDFVEEVTQQPSKHQALSE